MKAVRGEKGLVEPTFVYLPGIPGGAEIAKKTGCDFFSVPVELGVSRPLPSNAVAVLSVFLLTESIAQWR